MQDLGPAQDGGPALEPGVTPGEPGEDFVAPGSGDPGACQASTSEAVWSSSTSSLRYRYAREASLAAPRRSRTAGSASSHEDDPSSRSAANPALCKIASRRERASCARRRSVTSCEHALPHPTAVGSRDQHRVVVQPDHLPGGRHDPVFDVERFAGPVRPLGFLQDVGTVVGVQHPHPQLEVIQALLRRVAGELLVAGADVERRRTSSTASV